MTSDSLALMQSSYVVASKTPPLIVMTFFDSKPSPPSAYEKPRILPPCIVRFPSALMHLGFE